MHFRVLLMTLTLLVFPLFVVRAQETATKKLAPKDNLHCWVKTACNADLDNNGKEDGRWDNTTTAAITECLGGEYGYCYAQPEPLALNVAVPLDETTYKTSVTDFGDYINTFYNYLIGVSATIAVVMTMVAGAQYVAAAGSGDVGKAKERIRNAVTGFVLLMFAVLLLETVNPQLRKLEVPPIPKIRQTLVYTEDTSCEYYLEKGYDVDGIDEASFTTEAGTPLCGQPDSNVLKDPQGQELTDVTCRWSWCGGEFIQHSSGIPFPKVCLEVSGKSMCVACQDVITGITSDTVTPSEGACSSLTPEEMGAQYYAQCVFTRSHGFSQLQGPVGQLNGQCAAIGIDCSTMDLCAGYNLVNAENNDGSEHLWNLGDSSIGYGYLQTICESNPCKEQLNNTDCTYGSLGAGIQSCY